MHIEQIWTESPLRNYNYLLGCEESGEALVIDPIRADLCLARAEHLGMHIRYIVNTHEHLDHIEGNQEIIDQTGASLLAHHNARINGINQGLKHLDQITLGSKVILTVLNTPGHTMSHLCLYYDPENNPQSQLSPCLFSGDTLFNAGVGHCKSGGNPEQLFKTTHTIIVKLPDNTCVYPGHDYLLNNLAFTLDRETDNEMAKTLFERHKNHDPENAFITTLALEKEINTFLRLQQPSIINTLTQQFPDIQTDPKSVFLKLRELRNHW